MRAFWVPFTISILALGYGAAAADLPAAIAAPGETVTYQVHALGAQIYECMADGKGKLTWQYHEPIATLMRDGTTVGRHYAGPSWEIGLSQIKGKVTATSPASNSKDIPWLKLAVPEPTDDGALDGVTTVQRINTTGGVVDGECAKSGDFRAESYEADYLFLKKQP
jgi:hypothetical protein